MFDSKKLKIIYCCDIYYCIDTGKIFYDYKHLPFSSKSYQPKMSFIENKHLLGFLMSYPGLLQSKLMDNWIKTWIKEKVEAFFQKI